MARKGPQRPLTREELQERLTRTAPAAMEVLQHVLEPKPVPCPACDEPVVVRVPDALAVKVATYMLGAAGVGPVQKHQQVPPDKKAQGDDEEIRETFMAWAQELKPKERLHLAEQVVAALPPLQRQQLSLELAEKLADSAAEAGESIAVGPRRLAVQPE